MKRVKAKWTACFLAAIMVITMIQMVGKKYWVRSGE